MILGHGVRVPQRILVVLPSWQTKTALESRQAALGVSQLLRCLVISFADRLEHALRLAAVAFLQPPQTFLFLRAPLLFFPTSFFETPLLFPESLGL